MRTTFQRRVARAARLWDSDYLVMRPLQEQLQQACARLSGRVLDLGCGNRPYYHWLVNATQYVPYDIDPGGSAPEVVGKAQVLPFQDRSFDSVLSTQVLEHVPEPWLMVEEISRVLRPGGLLVLSAPQSWRLHEEPFDFYRYTRYGLQCLFARAGLSVVAVGCQGGVWLHIGQMLNNTMWLKHPASKYSPVWFSQMIGTLVINQTCAWLDRVWRDEDDTLNLLVVAEKL